MKDFSKMQKYMFPLAAAGIAGLTEFGLQKMMTTEKSVRQDSLYMESLEREARAKGLAKGSSAYKDYIQKKVDARVKNIPLQSGLGAGLGAGLITALTFGSGPQGGGSYRRYHGSYSQPSMSDLKSQLGLSGNERTKAEVRKAFHALARKHHPDLGGDSEKMKTINKAWEDIQNTGWFQKLAFENAFWAGFEKRALSTPPR